MNSSYAASCKGWRLDTSLATPIITGDTLLFTVSVVVQAFHVQRAVTGLHPQCCGCQSNREKPFCTMYHC